jgi:gamma-glutamyl-gamma-aminobutyrate hydrolase PuuD
MPKVFLAGSLGDYSPFTMFGKPEDSFNYFIKKPQNISLVVLPGGSDISPTLYGHEHHSKTYTSTHREKFELEVLNYALANKIPIVGICRGGQL